MRRRSVAICLLIFSGALSACADSEKSPKSSDAAGVVGGDFHSLVADPLVSGRIYVGGHAAVSQSNDSGTTWVAADALINADAMGWSISGDWAAHVDAVLNDNALAAAMGTAAAARSLHYAWSTTAARLRRLYGDVSARTLVHCS